MIKTPCQFHMRAANPVRAWLWSAWLIAVSLPVAASDMSGISAVFIGIPGMALAALIFGVLAGVPRRHPAVYAITAVIAAFVLLPFGWMMGSDALSTLHKGYPGYAVTYFVLYALAAVLFVVFTARFFAHRRALASTARG